MSKSLSTEDPPDENVRALWQKVFPDLVTVLGHPERDVEPQAQSEEQEPADEGP